MQSIPFAIGSLMMSGALLVASSQPAHSQDFVSLGAAGTAAYDRGAGSGLSAVTLSEKTNCVAHWLEWYLGYEQAHTSQTLLSQLPDDLGSEQSREIATAWFMHVKDLYVKRDDNDAEMVSALARIRPALKKQVQTAVAGDEKLLTGITEVLGTCRTPK